MKDYETFFTNNENKSSKILITVEHAGNEWPADEPLYDMPENWQTEHYAYDRGVKEFAIGLSNALDCQLILGKFSRVLIDLNRVPGADDIIKTNNDGVSFLMNLEPIRLLDHRFTKYYVPYHQKVRELLSQSPDKIHICIHSYIRQKKTDDFDNPWHLGIQYPIQNPVVKSALDYFLNIKDTTVGDNLPYNLRKGLPGSISLHAAAFGINTVELEFRDDQLTDIHRRSFWHEYTEQWLRLFN